VSLQTRLTALAQAVGADIKAINLQLASLSPANVDPWVSEVISANVTNSTVTGSALFSGFAPTPSTRYIVDVLLSVTGSTATGVQTALTGPTTGITRSAVKIVSASAPTLDKVEHLALNAWQIATAGLPTPSLLMIQAIVETGATVGAGKITTQFRSETAGSVVTVHPGSSMRWRSL
jgi:hypothetical protein